MCSSSSWKSHPWLGRLHRAQGRSQPKFLGMPVPMKPSISSRGSPPLVLAALCGSWAGAAAPDKEGARPCPAPGGEGQQKTAEPESPGHPSLPSELELQGDTRLPMCVPIKKVTQLLLNPLHWQRCHFGELQTGPCFSETLAFRKKINVLLFLTFSYYLCAFNPSLCHAELMKKQFRGCIPRKIGS